ncbi:hypothetical protein KR51_00011070 [Rubidibacter lacunae KORDI 51-2]|uniref:Glycosyltransferase RgtA/B/C/D-like domain-containing protein n=1 Tax=Rubidibacter lacunae KORDI 51-2 TaxID=582515 RepID=U5DCB8_9CHRO|nr:glycosyltransferase family 39 protein [Rubidibacter lacunae]ERN42178.1 hypothetical protein KR51_00011070 [Rubidibacter lacunae KORDI 51-2]
MKRYAQSWVLALGLMIRIAWAIAVPVQPVSDSIAYDTLARSLVSGSGYGFQPGDPSAYWPPGTSFVYAVLYAIFGTNYLPVVLLNLGLFLILSAVTMSLTAQWFGRRTAIITGILLACWPLHVQMTTILASELLFTTLVVVAWRIWLNEQITLRLRTIAVGILMGGAVYVRTTALLLPGLFVWVRSIKIRKLFESAIAGLLVLIIALGLVAPWSYRNYRVLGELVLVSTNGGPVFWMGNNSESTGDYMPLPPEVKGMSEVERASYLKKLAVQHVREQPLQFVRRSVVRLFKTHNRETIGIAWNAIALRERYGDKSLTLLKAWSQFYWIAVLGLAIIGTIRLSRQAGWLAVIAHPAVSTWSYFAGVHAVVIANDRYHFPSTPFIAMLAAYSIVGMLSHSKTGARNSEVKVLEARS